LAYHIHPELGKCAWRIDVGGDGGSAVLCCRRLCRSPCLTSSTPWRHLSNKCDGCWCRTNERIYTMLQLLTLNDADERLSLDVGRL